MTNIRAARERIGISQTNFAKVLGRHKRTIIRWERGHSTPSRADLEAISTLVRLASRNERRGGKRSPGRAKLAPAAKPAPAKQPPALSAIFRWRPQQAQSQPQPAPPPQPAMAPPGAILRSGAPPHQPLLIGVPGQALAVSADQARGHCTQLMSGTDAAGAAVYGLCWRSVARSGGNRCAVHGG